MKIGFCFAGQGAQAVGMGEDFYNEFEMAKEIFNKYEDIKELCFKDQDNLLNQTAYAQKAMLLVSYIIASLLKDKGIEPEYACGLSLGEYSALAFANVWNLDDAIKIVSERGKIMQNALPLGTTKMAAIIGLDRETILNEIKDIKGVCEIANYNCPGQIVISGDNEAIDIACQKLLEKKARRALPLNVSGAFHSSLLNDASKELRKVLDTFSANNPVYKIVYNVSAKEESRPLYDILEEQICHSVYFEDSIRYMIDKGVDTFVEIGPGRTLTGFIKKIDKDVTVYNVTDLDTFKACVEALNGNR